MEWNVIEGNWTQLSAAMKQKWGALTADDLQFVDRNKGALVAKVRERTGLMLDTVERQLDAMVEGLAPAQPEKAPEIPARLPPSGAKPLGPG